MSTADVLPPSPPDTSHRTRVSLFPSAKPTTSTPDDSPASFLPSSGNGSRKKVEFSPWPNILDPHCPEQSVEHSILKTLPKSKDCQTIAKSILKTQVDQQSPTGLDGASDAHPAVTMDSLVQALGNNDKTTSIDAYQSLANLIKAYDEVPDDTDTCGNVASITRCIKRDLMAQEAIPSTPTEINVITQALKVTVILVWSEYFSALIPDDFRIFITDRAIGVLADHTAPKVVVVHYMHVLAMQNFKAALFTSGTRTVKLLDALREITEHVQGKGVVAERLLVYQKLIEQARPIMKSRAALWVKEVLQGLSSNVKEIRDKAVSVSSRAVTAFPTATSIAQAARDALAEESNERTLSTLMSLRLDRMITGKNEAAQVPQIWSLVMLLCNSVDVRLDAWKHIRDWLRVIQRCFNCSDTNVRVQAFLAWNRFIYITKPHEASESTVSMLAKPILAQIERSGPKSSNRGTRSAAVSSYCVLLYYAFRPAASHKQNTRSWNHYIVKMITSQFLSRSSANADLCSRILKALFWKDEGVSRIWNENRAHDNKLMEPEELPAIDCKWVRSKAGPILEVFRLLFKHSAWGPSIQHSDQALVVKAWRSFLRSLKESACKEIKPSTDTRKALGGVVDFLNRISSAEDHQEDEHTMWQARAALVCKVALIELGPMAILGSYDFAENPQLQNLVFTELTRCSFDNLLGSEGKETMNVQNVSQTGEGSMSIDIQKCMSILNQRLVRAYTKTTHDDEKTIDVLNLAAEFLGMIPTCVLHPCLQTIVDGIAVFLKDEREILKSKLRNLMVQSAWENFSTHAIKTLMRVNRDSYASLDLALAAAMGSTNDFTADRMSILWNQIAVDTTEGQVGPLLKIVLADIATKAEKNQKEAEMRLVSDSVQSDMPFVHVITKHPAITTDNDDDQDLPVQQIGQTEDIEKDQLDKVSIRLETPTTVPRLYMEWQQRDRPDNIVITDLNNSSPTQYDDRNSPMLPDTPTEARGRQHTDRIIEFPDLEIGVQSKASASSRATSVDCEMARKIAASENLPTTPTINRHTIGMDYKAMPSPTPKARKHISCAADIEIPSSPPSAIINRNNDMEFANMRESPPRVIDMVEIEHHPDGQDLTSIANEVESDQVPNIVPARITDTSSPVHTSPQVNSQAISQAQSTARDGCDQMPRREAEVIRSPTTSDSDDDPSGSQLSQNLDWHISAEAKTIEQPVVMNGFDSHATRKRKRKEVDYAELSGRQTRRRVSGSKSAEATDAASQNLPSDSMIVDDTVSVNHENRPASESSKVMSSFKQAEVDEAFEERSSRPASWPGSVPADNRRQTRQQKGKTIVSDIAAPSRSAAIVEVADHNQAAVDIHPVTKITEGSKQGKEKMDITGDEEEQAQAQAQIHTHNEDIPRPMNIILALQLALDGLKNNNSKESELIDLKAIDDLCFQIRYQAQEMVRERS